MKGKKKWRLTKTLSRRIEVRPIENEDLKYAWAAYKMRGLAEIGMPAGLAADQFKREFESFILSRTHAAWTTLGETKKGFLPIGFGLGNWGPAERFIIMSAVIWLPWASCRNVLEGTIGFFNVMRKQLPIIVFTHEQHKPLYEICCMHGIMHRIGTSHSMGEKMAVFEARK